MTKIKVAGLQRSGTNWVEVLIAANLAAPVEKDVIFPFFKHCLPGESLQWHENAALRRLRRDGGAQRVIETSPDLGVVVVLKRLDQWIESIQRSPMGLVQKRPELAGLGKKALAEFYWGYEQDWKVLARMNGRVLVVNYLDVLADIDSFLYRVMGHFGIEPRTPFEFADVSHVKRSESFTEERRQAYLRAYTPGSE